MSETEVPVKILFEVNGKQYELGTVLSTEEGWRREVADLLRGLADEIEEHE